MDEKHYTSLNMSGQSSPAQQNSAPNLEPAPRVNSTLALVVLGLVTAGIMLGYLLGRSSVEQREPVIAQLLTTTPAPTTMQVLEPDVSPQELSPVSYSQRFAIEIPEPQNCIECITSTDTFLQVTSRGEAVSETGEVLPSLEDWRFTVQELTPEATAVAGIPSTLFDEISARSLQPVRFTNTDSEEESVLTLDNENPIIIDDLVYPYFIAETNSFGTGYQHVLIMESGDTSYFFSFEFVSEKYDGVFRDAVQSFRIRTQEIENEEATDSASASGPARIINQEEPEFLLQ